MDNNGNIDLENLKSMNEIIAPKGINVYFKFKENLSPDIKLNLTTWVTESMN